MKRTWLAGALVLAAIGAIACDAEEPGGVGAGGAGSAGTSAGGSGGSAGTGGTGEAGSGGTGEAGSGGTGEAGSGGTGEGGSGGTGGSIVVPIECDDGCPEERPFCTPSGTCSACESGDCGGGVIGAFRFEDTGHAPAVAAATPEGQFLAGVIDGSIDLGGGVLTADTSGGGPLGRGDLWFAELGADGDHLRSVAWDSIDGAFVQRLEVGRDGRRLVMGFFYDGLTIGGAELTETSEITSPSGFVAVLDANGQAQFTRVFEATEARLLDAALLPDGDLVIAGQVFPGDTIEFGGGELEPQGANSESFLMRYDADGRPRWAKLFGENPIDNVRATANGDLIIAGDLSGGYDYGGGPLLMESSYAVYVVRLNGDGEHVWSRRYPEAGANAILSRYPGLSVGADGSILLYAEAFGDLGFPGGGTFEVQGHFAPCLFRFDPQGGFLSARELPAESGFRIRDLALDPWNKAVIYGDFDGPMWIDGEVADPASREAIVLRMDDQLAPMQVHRIAGNGPMLATALSVAPNGDIVVAGSYANGVDLGGGTDSDGPGFFVERFSP